MSLQRTAAPLDAELKRVIETRHHDPARVLGRHAEGEKVRLRALVPGARWVRVAGGPELTRLPQTDLFEVVTDATAVPPRYRLAYADADGQVHEIYDPYAFPPQLAEFDLHLFGEGRHWHAQRFLGAHARTVEDVEGVLFATWAPNAERVSVVGDFNAWDGRRHPMRARGESGVWELFIPGVEIESLYKFELRNRNQGTVFLKTDPYGRRFQVRPDLAALVTAEVDYPWHDDPWLTERHQRDWYHAPMSIYEVHLGSWLRREDGGFLNYRELAHRLADYALEQGFTHIELMPVTEHPLDASWGYQTVGFFAPTSRHGTPEDFCYLVDHCHSRGLGVILDWVPGHFPRDETALARFDGTPLYEHADPRRGEHRDWGTLIFDYGRPEVRSFLLSSALYWLETFHLDGLRLDAVASLLYLDYSRNAEDWLPNVYGGRENLDAIDFLREVNNVTQGQQSGTLLIAEESTAWPQVTRPTWVGGLGFSLKWNMGWMHDTLTYIRFDPIHRHYHHDNLTFGALYSFTENFVLPFSHDEVVHGKGSMLGKMPGDRWQRFANLRLLYTYMFTYPGKKLLFMGCEFGQEREWDHDRALDWSLLEHPEHCNVKRLVRDLNALHCHHAALHYNDFEADGFEWIDCHDAAQSVLSYLRHGGDTFVVVLLNFTPLPRYNYRIGVPAGGPYHELMNSDSAYYGGSNVGNGDGVNATSEPYMGRPYSLALTLPPLAGIVLQPQETGGTA